MIRDEYKSTRVAPARDMAGEKVRDYASPVVARTASFCLHFLSEVTCPPWFGCKVLVLPGKTMKLLLGASLNFDAEVTPRVERPRISASNQVFAWSLLASVTNLGTKKHADTRRFVFSRVWLYGFGKAWSTAFQPDLYTKQCSRKDKCIRPCLGTVVSWYLLLHSLFANFPLISCCLRKNMSRTGQFGRLEGPAKSASHAHLAKAKGRGRDRETKPKPKETNVEPLEA